MKTYKIIFSPTGGTAKVANAITKNWPVTDTIDISNDDFNMTLEDNSLTLIAMPSFGGLAPQLALDRLTKIKCNNCKCVIVAVYGNRAYDDTLIQMKDYAENIGFEVIAAISAVAEHSIIHTYAAGRPDAKDSEQLSSFGEQILKKAYEKSGSIIVPGNKPYKKAGPIMVPKANSSCTACGLCARNCPTKSIELSNPRVTNKNKCIGCMRCVSLCPVKARNVNPIMTKIAAIIIKKACSKFKKNELFI